MTVDRAEKQERRNEAFYLLREENCSSTQAHTIAVHVTKTEPKEAVGPRAQQNARKRGEAGTRIIGTDENDLNAEASDISAKNEKHG